jgi:hypothetical protein
MMNSKNKNMGRRGSIAVQNQDLTAVAENTAGAEGGVSLSQFFKMIYNGQIYSFAEM